MASAPPKKNAAYTLAVALPSQANTKILQVNPTLAVGDAKISKDGGAFANTTNAPAVTPAGGKRVAVVLTSTEMNADQVTVIFSDAAGDEWCDVSANIDTSVDQIDDLATPAEVATALTTTVADSVPADGTRPSIAQGILMITRFLMEKGLSGTTLTVKKEDGTTASMTFTLDSATAPTTITRAS